MIVFFWIAIGLSLIFLINRESFTCTNFPLPWVIAAVLSNIVVIIVSLKAFSLAPNPGYVSGLLSLCAVFLTCFAILFLGSSFSIWKCIGIVLACFAAILLSY